MLRRKSLSTLATIVAGQFVAENSDSQKSATPNSATVAVVSPFSATVAVFGESHFSATVWTGLKPRAALSVLCILHDIRAGKSLMRVMGLLNTKLRHRQRELEPGMTLMYR